MKKGVWKTVFASVLIRALAATWRFRVQGAVPHQAGIVAFWHDEMLPVWKFFATRKRFPRVAGLTSLSKDGDILAKVLRDWHYAVVRGSSSQGGKEAFERAQHFAETGYLVLLTPDGPRGPRHQMKAGAVVLAQRSDTPLYLCRVQVSRGKRFEHSWDKFLLPLPFAHITIFIVSTVCVPLHAERDEVQSYIAQSEAMMNSAK